MKFAIITGGSKGIGNALALKFKAEGYTIFSFSRSKSNLLTDNEQINCDLLDLNDTEKKAAELFLTLVKSNPTEIILINNAGTLGEVDRIENMSALSIAEAIQLNVTIPTLLSSLFIAHFNELETQKTILNISSGAAVNAYYGWSVYCASKSALDMLTKVIAVEQKAVTFPVKAIAIYPGVVDTAMQNEIRSKNESQFENIDRFIELKETNSLSTPQQAAESIYKIYSNKSLPNGTIIDVRNV